ncbi:iron complex outermembrane recepter protein [Loktanella atrilutea]|uniref:Iron complex outermembrane recepter protein n=1 Tax=Loktanella atrilutea TaxID=366533 RepID=A0A1M4XI05_LOKAT|nr:TonB-dependent siderophore receptor [Loktanella atrilutea]SHE93307.1 iron complex outermembrane recepter protein [Loktanella atrilutea]
MREHHLIGGRRSFALHALLGCTSLNLLPMSALAQDAATPYRLSPIIVTGAVAVDDDAQSVVAQELWVGGKVATSILDTPASVSVVTAQEIEARNADTLETVLQYTPGIHTDFYGSDDRNDYVLMRGFQATSYREGMTLGSMRGVREDPFAYARVEAIRGANSTLFGVSDPGGSINFVTKTPRFERFGDAYLTAGSNDHAEVGIDFGDILDDEATLAYRLTAKAQDSGLDYATSRDDSTFLMGGLTWSPSDATELTVTFDRLTRDGTPNSGGYPMDRQYDRSDFFGEPDYNDHAVDRSTLSAFLRHEFANGLNLRANLRYSDLTDDFGYAYIVDPGTGTGTVFDRAFFGTDRTAQELIGNVMVQYDAQFGAIDSSTLAGIEFRDAQTESASYYTAAPAIDVADSVYSGAPVGLTPYATADEDYTTKSLFVQQNLSFDDRFIATVGLRRDWLELASVGDSFGVPSDLQDDFAETSWRGALTYKINEGLSTYASYVQSVAPPEFGVSPERGHQYEVGVKYQPAGTTALISAAAFDLEKNNITVPVVQADGSITRELVGKTRARGFEIEGKAELSNNLSIIGGYSYVDAEVERAVVRGTDVSGQAFANVPRHTASLWMSYAVPESGNLGAQTFGIGARYLGDYYFGLPNADKAEAAILVDAAYTYAFDAATEVALNVSNLFDEQHVVGSGTANYYNPARNVAVTLRRSW